MNEIHPQMVRLYHAAQALKGLKFTGKKGQSALARLLDETPQTIKNWETRGISKAGMIKAQHIVGCMVEWLETGNGPMNLFNENEFHAVSIPLTKSKRVWVIGNGQGGIPDRIWDDGGYPVGASDKYSEVATDDEHAFIICVRGDSMVPRYMPGEYALVEPSVNPEIEDDVLVRLKTGETMLKRLLSRRAGIRLGSYNNPEILNLDMEKVDWIYHVSHPIPARKIKHWIGQDDEAEKG